MNLLLLRDILGKSLQLRIIFFWKKIVFLVEERVQRAFKDRFRKAFWYWFSFIGKNLKELKTFQNVPENSRKFRTLLDSFLYPEINIKTFLKCSSKTLLKHSSKRLFYQKTLFFQQQKNSLMWNDRDRKSVFHDN